MNAPEPHQLTREELYALVWAKPVAQAAKDWGLSDVGLAKLCRRHCVPLPYRGFWARKAAGQTPKPIPLPPARRGLSATVWLDPKPPAPPKPSDPEIDEALAADRVFAAQDRVPEDLRGCDPLVSRTRVALQEGHTDDYGRSLAHWNADCPIRISVSRGLVHRALRIGQGIIEGATRRGYGLRIEDRRKTAEIVVRGNGFGFSIEEPTKRFENQPDPKHPDGYFPRYRYEPRGRLVLKLERNGYARNNWADSEKHKVEDCLPELFQKLAVHSIEQARSDAEWKIKQDQWRAAEQLRAEYDAASKQAVDLMKRLDNADGLRRLLARFESEGVDMNRPVGEYPTWRDWLTELIRATDPIADIRAGQSRLGRGPTGSP